MVALVAFSASGEPAAPVGLLVNGVANPLAIDRGATRFTWMSKDTDRGERQTAYEIRVFERPASTLQRFIASGAATPSTLHARVSAHI